MCSASHTTRVIECLCSRISQHPVTGRTFAEGGPGVIPVAMQMIMATRAKQKPPIVAAVNKQDNAKLKTVKSIVNKMVVYDPNRRISAAEAARTLESVVGKFSSHFREWDAAALWLEHRTLNRENASSNPLIVVMQLGQFLLLHFASVHSAVLMSTWP